MVTHLYRAEVHALLALLDEVPSDGHRFVVEAGPQKIGFAIDSALEGDGFEP
jgi:hypothetical protein